MKRTTLILQEQTVADVKQIAAREGRTLSQVVDEMLRAGVAQRRRAVRDRPAKVRLPVFETGRPHVNIADRGQLHDAM